jgi:hypothetical protein
MASRDTQDVLIIEQPSTAGHLRDTQDALIFETPAAALASGHLRDTQDCLIFEFPAPYGTATLSFMFVYAAGNTVVGFTPQFPPVGKQAFGEWGMQAVRHDSVTVDGIKSSVLDRLDHVTTLNFPFVTLSDMASWKQMETNILTGEQFLYCPLPDYPGAPGTLNQFSLVQILSMDWTPKFASPGIFSLGMQLRLIGDM